MKAKKRHQLQTNILAERMGRLLQGMKSTPNSTSVVVWVFVVLALVTAGIWQFGAHATLVGSSSGWVQMDRAIHDPGTGADGLEKISDEQAGTFPGRAARFQIARLQLQRGQETFTGFERTLAIQQISSAGKLYGELAKVCADAPELAQEALMGVAKAEEALVGINNPAEPEMDLDKAVTAYQQLADKYPNSILGKQAATRLTELETHRTQALEFYKQLNAFAVPQTKLEPKEPESK